MKGRPIDEQVIVITGASSGIGRATAREAARRGSRVVLAARNASDLEEAAEECRRAGGEAIAVPTDVTDLRQVEALARRAVETFGRIDTWVNNAAVTLYGTFRDTPAEDFRRIMDVNFMGQIHGAKAALPHLEASGGALICVGSVLSDRGAPLQSGYSATKHASINTPFFEKARTHMSVQPRPIAPVYSPEAVADAILHAAVSNEQELYVGGGGKLLSIANRISPRLVDLLLRMSGFDSQLTDRPRSPDSPNNLYAPLEDDGGVHGEFTGEERRGSAYTRLERSARGASIAGATLLGASALALSAQNARRGGPLRRAIRRRTSNHPRPMGPAATITTGILAVGAAMLAGKAIVGMVVEG